MNNPKNDSSSSSKRFLSLSNKISMVMHNRDLDTSSIKILRSPSQRKTAARASSVIHRPSQSHQAPQGPPNSASLYKATTSGKGGTSFQPALHQEIWDTYLTTDEWAPIVQKIISSFQKKHISFEMEPLCACAVEIESKYQTHEILLGYKAVIAKGMMVFRVLLKDLVGDSFLEKIVEMWSNYYTKILIFLQGIFGMCSPVLISHIRTHSIAAFRDHVLFRTQNKQKFEDAINGTDKTKPANPILIHMLLILQSCNLFDESEKEVQVLLEKFIPMLHIPITSEISPSSNIGELDATRHRSDSNLASTSTGNSATNSATNSTSSSKVSLNNKSPSSKVTVNHSKSKKRKTSNSSANPVSFSSSLVDIKEIKSDSKDALSNNVNGDLTNLSSASACVGTAMMNDNKLNSDSSFSLNIASSAAKPTLSNSSTSSASSTLSSSVVVPVERLNVDDDDNDDNNNDNENDQGENKESQNENENNNNSRSNRSSNNNTNTSGNNAETSTPNPVLNKDRASSSNDVYSHNNNSQEERTYNSDAFVDRNESLRRKSENAADVHKTSLLETNAASRNRRRTVNDDHRPNPNSFSKSIDDIKLDNALAALSGLSLNE